MKQLILLVFAFSLVFADCAFAKSSSYSSSKSSSFRSSSSSQSRSNSFSNSSSDKYVSSKPSTVTKTSSPVKYTKVTASSKTTAKSDVPVLLTRATVSDVPTLPTQYSSPVRTAQSSNNTFIPIFIGGGNTRAVSNNQTATAVLTTPQYAYISKNVCVEWDCKL